MLSHAILLLEYGLGDVESESMGEIHKKLIPQLLGYFTRSSHLPGIWVIEHMQLNWELIHCTSSVKQISLVGQSCPMSGATSHMSWAPDCTLWGLRATGTTQALQDSCQMSPVLPPPCGQSPLTVATQEVWDPTPHIVPIMWVISSPTNATRVGAKWTAASGWEPGGSTLTLHRLHAVCEPPIGQPCWWA